MKAPLSDELIHVSLSDFGISVTTRLSQTRMADAIAMYLDPTFWWVSRVFVPEGYRGNGIGGQLLERLKTELSAREGFGGLVVVPGGYNSKLSDQQRFYRHHGFVRQRDGRYLWAVGSTNRGTDEKQGEGSKQ